MKRTITVAMIIAVGLLMGITTAFAQDRTTGAVKGAITDSGTNTKVEGATVVASSASLQGTQASITDKGGQYFISNLPPGVYIITVYYADAQFERKNVVIQLGKTAQVNIGVNAEAAEGETIIIEGRSPIIDQGSTKLGVVIDNTFTSSIPVGRTFGAVLGAAAGTQDDFYGVSFGGSSSLENVYIVEGLNTTDPAKNFLSTNLPNEFVQETEVITGGYNAEFGRSTGGVINVLTKSGSNVFAGSVWSYFTPGQLVADEKPSPREGSSIDRIDELAYAADVGAEIGGPIIKDKLWFHVGLNPSLRGFNIHRTISQLVDTDNDGEPDTDSSGFSVRDEVARKTLDRSDRTIFFTGKLTLAVAPEHQGSVSIFGNPRALNEYRVVTGLTDGQAYDYEDGAYDAAAKWTSKLNNNQTQIDAVVGYHRNVLNELTTTASDEDQIEYDNIRDLSELGIYEDMEGPGLPGECMDGGPDDEYGLINNCPVQFYNIGGIGFRETQTTSRISGLVTVTQRLNLAGQHAIKAGLDVEQQSYDHLSDFSGGERFRLRGNQTWRVDRWFSLDEPGSGEPCGVDTDGDGTPNSSCTLREDGLVANTATRNTGAFLQDSWQALPNLTFDLGLRWERQQLFYADEIVGKTSGVTGEPIPDEALDLKDLFAPRIGVIYDPTQEGRSKIFGHFGRFYESIPMDINARAFGSEIFRVNVVRGANFDEFNELPEPSGTEACTSDVDPHTCDLETDSLQRTDIFAGSGDTLLVPGIKAQYLDEWVGGAEYELLDDLKIGVTYQHRGIGRVIEDMSSDAGNNYVIGNPGSVDEDVVQDLRDEAAAIMTTDPGRAEFLITQANLFAGVVNFDKPSRTYDAVQVTANRRFNQNLFLQASYTWSKLKGNFPGLFSTETNQDDPNIISMYDLPELMANRYGALSFDRRHNVKVDGYYTLPVKGLGYFLFGTSVRATSGIPSNTLGTHISYGDGEAFVLPRGSGERLPFASQMDLKLQYGRELSKSTKVEAFVDIFNLFNLQPANDVDEIYTYDVVNPIVGGDASDLEHLKAYGEGRVVDVNPNYGNPKARQAPLTIRFGARVTF